MTILALNNEDFTITGYNRYTNIDANGVHSNASVSFPNNSQYEALTQVGEISALTIKIDGNVVYSLTNLHAKITNINENLYESTVNMSAQISFDGNAVSEIETF